MTPAILAALSLAPDASDEDALAAVASLRARLAEVPSLATENATLTAVVSEMEGQIAMLTTAAEATELEACIRQGLGDRKITPATEPALRAVGLTALRALLASSPVILDARTYREPLDNTPASLSLTHGEMHLCQRHGIDPELYAERKQALARGRSARA